MAEDVKEPKGSVLEEEKKEAEQLLYSDEEKKYISQLRSRLEHAGNMRDETYDEFDGLSLVQYWQTNERLANTMIRAKKNKGDIDYKSGTLRTKMFALLSAIQGLNLSPQVDAYDKNDLPIRNLGNIMEDILEKTAELERDEEKRLLRQYEYLFKLCGLAGGGMIGSGLMNLPIAGS